MNKDNINEFASFDEYLRQGEPSQKESAENWKTAIGLQAVDGLQPSAYLIDVAKRNIEGEISLDETRKLIDSYYQSNVRQAFLVFPQRPGSCQLSQHSERHRLLAYPPGSFLQELTSKRWLGSQK